MRFKEGDFVKIIQREATTADMKNGTFYPFFCGLAGTVDRIYDKEICIKVDPESLPEDVLKRHLSIQESIRRKWLNGLSGEARNKLTPEEKQFELAYTILVQTSDLEKAKPGEARPAAIKKLQPLNPPEPELQRADEPEEVASVEPEQAEAVETSVKAPKAKPSAAKAKSPRTAEASAPRKSKSAGEVKPLSTEDLEAAELAFLKEREKKLKGK